jgi:predicted neuraminidase
MKKFSLLFVFFMLLLCFPVAAKIPVNRNLPKNDSIKIESIFPFQQQHCHGSTLVELPNKDLLAAWFQGSGERTSDDVAIKGARYNHTTGKWGEPFILADVPDFPDINPVLFVDNKGKLWLFWYTVMAYQWSSSLLKYRISDNFMQKEGAPVWNWQDVIHMKPDGGKATEGIAPNDSFVVTLTRKFDEYYDYLKRTSQMKENANDAITNDKWEKVKGLYLDVAKGKNLISEGKLINDKGVKVSTRLGYPLMRRIGWQTRNKPLQMGKRMILPLYSDGLNLSLMAITEDQGAHWSFSEPILGGGAIQPSLALNKDGSLAILMRDNGPAPKRLMKSTSNDRGITWSSVEDTDIPNPGTAADVVVLKSGNWALIHNDIEDGRHRLSVWLSLDEGKTWLYRKILVNGQPGSAVRGHYPAIIQGKDSRIHVTYTNQVAGSKGQSDLKNIVHACFSEGWLMH